VPRNRTPSASENKQSHKKKQKESKQLSSAYSSDIAPVYPHGVIDIAHEPFPTNLIDLSQYNGGANVVNLLPIVFEV